MKPRTPQKLSNLKVIDYIRQNRYVIQGLRPARCQEYTVTATITWDSPKKNHGSEQYFLLFAQEPAPQFQYWRRYEVGKSKRFTLTDLSPDTRYVVCVFAAHNFGFAAMSRTLRFKTRSWWFQDDDPSATNKGSVYLALPTLSKW
uniref:Fibronectin type-III domain-containing protein n=1 Tax=Globodera pallida TaxID=36090 RepID=A0A183CNY3_GLOPA